MKTLSYILIFCLTTFSVEAQDANGLLSRVRSKLEQVKDYRGTATLSVDVSFMKVPDSKVEVYFMQPDQVKVVKPDGISILPKGGLSVSLNTLISGKEFTAVPGGYTSLNGKKLAIIKLLPTSDATDVVLSTLWVDESTDLVVKAITTTRESGTYESTLEYGQYAKWALPSKIIFEFNTANFKLPKGVTMEYEGSKKAKTGQPTGNGKGRVLLIYTKYIINKGLSTSSFK